MHPPPLRSTLFPYTTLFRSRTSPATTATAISGRCTVRKRRRRSAAGGRITSRSSHRSTIGNIAPSSDRKSTRLNSSHQIISYAVFCLKKKKKEQKTQKQKTH